MSFFSRTLSVILRCWTRWYDRDDPGGRGDWEDLKNLRMENPGKICLKPSGIDAVTVDGEIPAKETGQYIYYDALKLQYELIYYHLFFSYSTDIGFICRNEDQEFEKCLDYKVRFRCIAPPLCWTDWFDRDDPNGQGDYEDLKRLRKEYPGQICPKPFRIQAVTVFGNIPAEDTGHTFQAYNTEVGFICRNEDQQFGRCMDYKVRFRCPCFFPPECNPICQ
ncbi:cartilage intermediate layer protein 2-like [Nothobranchius furzeri]|uniref:Cartilage intermediate layer protein 2-like n=1 Tax=Nothobranchius furzeri TaxID=105023 RepID=A0A9D2Z130_NOTFU|nr:cartilage intermediate layer protein 2-like [Nothobranchius furzeri]